MALLTLSKARGDTGAVRGADAGHRGSKTSTFTARRARQVTLLQRLASTSRSTSHMRPALSPGLRRARLASAHAAPRPTVKHPRHASNLNATSTFSVANWLRFALPRRAREPRIVVCAPPHTETSRGVRVLVRVTSSWQCVAYRCVLVAAQPPIRGVPRRGQA